MNVPIKDAGWTKLTKMWLNGRPESTAAMYLYELRRFRQCVKDKPVPKVNLADLQAFVAGIEQTHKPRTVARMVATVRSFFSFCLRAGMIKVNPAAILRLVPVPNDLAERILTEKQVAALIARATTRRNRTLIQTLYLAGIRASEASGLRWIDLAQRANGCHMTVVGKGAKTRTIRIPEALYQSLQKLRPKSVPLDSPVFTTHEGAVLTRMEITKVVRATCKAAGVPLNASAHWLRHAHATHALEHGAPLALIQQTLGHTTIETTMRYLHISPDKSSSTFLRSA